MRSTTSEDDTTGTGNLIVGWDTVPNEVPSSAASFRTGSNNLVCGDDNDFMSYGGFLAGGWNVTSERYASASGGQVNTVSGVCATVSGGSGNSATGVSACVSGGAGNMASGWAATVGGGANNTAGGDEAATVSGGENLTEILGWGWMAGGNATPAFHSP